jgi:hypothetical protein
MAKQQHSHRPMPAPRPMARGKSVEAPTGGGTAPPVQHGGSDPLRAAGAQLQGAGGRGLLLPLRFAVADPLCDLDELVGRLDVADAAAPLREGVGAVTTAGLLERLKVPPAGRWVDVTEEVCIRVGAAVCDRVPDSVRVRVWVRV